jgi:hypothetical protein
MLITNETQAYPSYCSKIPVGSQTMLCDADTVTNNNNIFTNSFFHLATPMLIKQ